MGWIASTFTPKGRSNWTYRAFVEKPMLHMELFHSPTSDNVFNPEAYVETLRSRYSADLALQELGGQFIDNEKQLISYETMMACTDARCLRDLRAYSPTGPLYIGWDLGRSNNRSVIWTWEVLGDVAYCRECLVMHKTSYVEQEREFVRRIRMRNVAKVAIDKGIDGRPFADRYSVELGSRFEGVQMSAGMQGVLASYMSYAFEKGKVRIPDDDDLRDDLALVDRPIERAGGPVLTKDQVHEDDAIGHADRFWAAALAYKAIHETRVLPQTRPRLPTAIRK
jgi:phage FluMu gp28-like protein